MRLIIAGSRHFQEDVYEIISDWMFANREVASQITEVVSGGATGVDAAGEVFATNVDWSLVVMKADWKQNGKAAGPIRNRKMAEYADSLLLIWDGKSKGSSSMKKEMQRLNKPIYEVIIDVENSR